MILIPAIDIKNQKCVRLYKGDFAKEKIYSDSPVEIAKKWESMGAKLIHLVDLDGAVEGKSINYEIIKEISNSVQCEIQIGGGIRNIEIVDSYLSLGIRRVILGTSAFEDNVFLDRAIKENPGRIAIGIDIKDNFVAIKGWESKIRMGLKEALTKFRKKNIDLIVLTSVDRDGTLEGYNVELVNEYLKNTSVPLIVSGGIKNEDDLISISKLCNHTIYGVILGKSLYEDKIDLKKCIEVYEDVS